LLLDPDRVSAEALALALEAADAEVAWVREADEALVQGSALVPEAVVADLDEMPGEAEWPARAECRAPASRRGLSTDDTPASLRRARRGFDASCDPSTGPPRRTIRALLAPLACWCGRRPGTADSPIFSRGGFEVERLRCRAASPGAALEPAVVPRTSASATATAPRRCAPSAAALR
jgi:hypothetical protein